MSLLHKKEKHNKNNDQLIRLMTPMIAGVLACIFCLVSMTWAWFTASVNTPTQTMQSATRSTSVMVYQLSQPEDGNSKVTKTLVKPEISEVVSLFQDSQTTDEDASVVMAGEPLVWNLSPEKSYEVVMTGGGTASTGYCKIALSHTLNNSDTETKLYKTSSFKKDNTVKFTYNTGGFSDVEGVTETQWKEYVEKTTPPTLTIASYWGKPENDSSQVSLMSLRHTLEEEIMLLSDGDVLGLTPIPCPEAKAETEIELEGFETEEGAVISAEEDYKVSLTLKEGYEMPSEVVVNIGGKDYVVSTQGSEVSEEAPYYDAQNGVLTVPSALLSDGATVSVKATATQIPVEQETEEEKIEEVTEETEEETTDNSETEEDTSADTPSDNNIVADNPTKKEEDDEKSNNKPDKVPTGGGGNDDDDDDDDKADDNSEDSSNDNASSSEDEKTDEKADVKLNLSQLTINLEETQIPTNADLVLTLSAKKDMKLPEEILITLDKTIRDEDIKDEEIKEDKTEYIINTDGKNNPEGFEFDTKSGKLTISSELLEGVREITIADTEKDETTDGEEKASITFEVKNLTFDFEDDEIATNEDVVITFSAGEGYKLPETIVITIDGKEYTIYTSEEESDKNPDGVTFNAETGKLTISKDLLEDVKEITITAEGVKKEDDKSEEKEENPDTDKKDESEDKDAEGKENGAEGGDAADKEPETGTDIPGTEDKTETEGGTDVEGGEEDKASNPETNPDNTTEGEGNDKNEGEGEDEDNGETETPKPDTEPTNTTTPDTEDNTNTEQGGENAETGDGEDSAEDKTEGTPQPTPDTESGDDSETPAKPSEPSTDPTTPTEPSEPSTEPTAPVEPSEPVVTPETPKTETPATSGAATGENDGDNNGEKGNIDNASTEGSNSGNDSTHSNASNESTTTSDTPSVNTTAPTTSSPATSETSTSTANTQASSNTSSTSASSSATPSTNSNSNGVSKTSDTTTSSASTKTPSEE